jgi:hypothetical protein
LKRELCVLLTRMMLRRKQAAAPPVRVTSLRWRASQRRRKKSRSRNLEDRSQRRRQNTRTQKMKERKEVSKEKDERGDGEEDIGTVLGRGEEVLASTQFAPSAGKEVNALVEEPLAIEEAL